MRKVGVSRRRILSAVLVLLLGVGAASCAGGDQEGSPAHQVSAWVENSGFGEDIGTLVADNARIAEETSAGAMHAACETMDNDAGTALDELPILFGWLEGTVELETLPPMPVGPDEEAWSPPPTVATWGFGIPLETVRFAATNHLCVELNYDGDWRLIEPYSLRRSSAGRLLLHAERSDGGGHRAYGVDKIAGLRVSTTPFRPRYPIEFSSKGPLLVPSQSRSTTAMRPRGVSLRTPRADPVHVYQCSRCGKEFRHSRRDPTLREHEDPGGHRCLGRRGIYVGTRY